MTIEGIVKDTETGDAVSDARVSLSAAGTELAVMYTDASGRFSHEASESFRGDTLTCSASRQGYHPRDVVYRIDQDVLELEVQLDAKGTAADRPIPLWLGMPTRRRFLMIGSIAFFAAMAALAIAIAAGGGLGVILLIVFVLYFLLGTAYVVVASVVVKGYLVPILGGLTVFFWLLMAGIIGGEPGDSIGGFAVIALAYVVVGAIAVTIARVVATRRRADS